MSQSENRPSNFRPLPLVLIGIGLLLMVAAVLIWQAARPGSGQGQAAAPQPTATTETTQPAAEIPRVQLADAKKALDAKDAIFVDVRSAESFAEAHIPGALNIPLAELENRASELNPNAWIITYCT